MGNGDTEDPRYGCGAWRSGVSSASFVLVDNSDSIEENDVLEAPDAVAYSLRADFSMASASNDFSSRLSSASDADAVACAR